MYVYIYIYICICVYIHIYIYIYITKVCSVVSVCRQVGFEETSAGLHLRAFPSLVLFFFFCCFSFSLLQIVSLIQIPEFASSICCSLCTAKRHLRHLGEQSLVLKEPSGKQTVPKILISNSQEGNWPQVQILEGHPGLLNPRSWT